MIDVFLIDGFLSSDACADIIAEMSAADGSAAVVYGTEKAGSVEPLVRKVTRVAVSADTTQRITNLLLERKHEIGDRFDVKLTKCEEPQFLRYKPGDFFVAHQDGNTPLIRDASLGRKVSVSIFLNARDEYTGGSLVLHGNYPDWDYRQDVTSRPGTLVAFRSETTHEVMPITGGERFAIVAWFRQ